MVNFKITTYLINSWRALKTGFQNPVGAISEARPVGNPNQEINAMNHGECHTRIRL